jgi:hypothetical protein
MRPSAEKRNLQMQISDAAKGLIERSPSENIFRITAKLSKKTPLTSFNDKHPAVFVLSTGRVGSQTMQGLLALSRRLVSLHQPEPLLFGLSKLAYEYGDEPSKRAILREAWWTCRKGLLQQSLLRGKGYIETSPQSTFLAGIIRDVVPSAKFIHLIRNPIDVIRSGMRRRWYVDHPWDPSRIVPHPDDSEAANWKQFSPLEKNIWLWKETNEWIFRFCSVLPKTNVLYVISEHIFSGSTETLGRLFDFVGCEVPHSRRVRRILRLKLNAQRSGEFPQKEEWTEPMKTLLDEMAGLTMRKAGYSLQ